MDKKAGNPLLYFVIGVFLWVIVDWGTAGGFRVSYFEKYGASLLLFYVGYPSIFSYLIFSRKWGGGKLFVATCMAILVIEGLFVRNPFLLSFPLLLIGIPLALCVYAPLTYFPLWIVRGEIGRNRGLVLFLSCVILLVIVLTTFGRGT